MYQIDLDGDGRCDFHEFCAAAIDHRELLTDSNLKTIFNMLDADQDSTINIDEFMHQLPTNMNKELSKVKIRKKVTGPFFQTNEELTSKK